MMDFDHQGQSSLPVGKNLPDLLPVHSRVLIQPRGVASTVFYNSRVEAISHTSVQLLAPVRSGQEVLFQQGMKVMLIRCTDQGIRQVPGVVEARLSGTPSLISVQISPEAEIVKIQRRSHVRHPLVAHIHISAKHGTPLDESQPHERIIRTKTIDISGGGLAFEVDVRLPVHTHLELEVYLENKEPPIVIDAEVVRVQTIGSTIQPSYLTGVRFANISQDGREEIIKHVLSVQRKHGHIPPHFFRKHNHKL